MAPFDQVRGQPSAVRVLQRALTQNRIHHAYRFEGPPGVGKELCAFEFARTLLCEREAERRPCGACRSCHRVVTLAEQEPFVPLHPDVVLVARGLYPPALIGRDRVETTAISVDQIRSVILGRVGYPPHEGRALVVIVRDADEMTSSAANALLKTLEEPHAGTYFVLLTTRPERLLDTVRSRTLPVRFGPLPTSVVGDILEEHGNARQVADIAQGSASLALELSQPELMAGREQFVEATLRAIMSPDLASGLEALDARQLGRQDLSHQLAFVAQALAQRGRDAVLASATGSAVEAERYFCVLRAISDLQRNAQPALVVESLVLRLQRATRSLVESPRST